MYDICIIRDESPHFCNERIGSHGWENVVHTSSKSNHNPFWQLYYFYNLINMFWRMVIEMVVAIMSVIIITL